MNTKSFIVEFDSEIDLKTKSIYVFDRNFLMITVITDM